MNDWLYQEDQAWTSMRKVFLLMETNISTNLYLSLVRILVKFSGMVANVRESHYYWGNIIHFVTLIHIDYYRPLQERVDCLKCQYCGSGLVFEFQLLPSLGTRHEKMSIKFIKTFISESDECSWCGRVSSGVWNSSCVHMFTILLVISRLQSEEGDCYSAAGSNVKYLQISVLIKLLN